MALSSEIQRIVAAFKGWDEEGTGLMSRQEFSELLRHLAMNVSDAELDQLFDAAASDGLSVGNLKYEDFLLWLWKDKHVDAVLSEGTAIGSSAPADAIEQHAAQDERDQCTHPASADGRKPQVDLDSDPIVAETLCGKPSDRPRFWQNAIRRAIEVSSTEEGAYVPERVQRYFQLIHSRLESQDYADQIRTQWFDGVLDADRDGKVSFLDAASLIAKSLQCAADFSKSTRPDPREIRDVFDAHASDSCASACGVLGQDEFLDLMRYLQIQVAEAVMPLSQIVRPDN